MSEIVLPVDIDTLDEDQFTELKRRVDNAAKHKQAVDAALRMTSDIQHDLRKTLGEGPVREKWTKPVGLEKCYGFGEVVPHNGKLWESLVPFNTSEPSLNNNEWRSHGDVPVDFDPENPFKSVDVLSREANPPIGNRQKYPALVINGITYDLRYVTTWRPHGAYLNGNLYAHRNQYFMCLIGHEDIEGDNTNMPGINMQLWELFGTSDEVQMLDIESY